MPLSTETKRSSGKRGEHARTASRSTICAPLSRNSDTEVAT